MTKYIKESRTEVEEKGRRGKALGRMHSAAEARAAFDIARATFDRVSVDLIYAP